MFLLNYSVEKIRGNVMDFLEIAPPIVWGTLVLFTGFFVLYKLADHWDKKDEKLKKECEG